MEQRKLRFSVVAAGAALALTAATGSASAAVVAYPGTGTFGVPNNTGQAGIPSQVFVPPGRTAVQGLELTQVKPSFPVGGGGDLQLRLEGPSGTEITLLGNSNCTTYPNTSAFTISDSAANSIDTPAFCATLPAGSGRPTDPLSTFNGSPSGGVWTVTVVDIGISATTGTFNGWTLSLNHANPTLTAKAAKLKVSGKLALSASCNANCTVVTGGDAKATSTKLAANGTGLIVANPTKKAKKRLAAGKKAKVSLTATDETGGTATTKVKVKLG